MASHHRKLIDDYATNLTALCKPYCDGAQQSNGFCLPSCFSVCPPESCKIPSPFPPPPPLTPPPSVSPSTVANQSQPLSRLLIGSLAVLATAFFLFTCYTIYKFYAVWSSSRQRRASQRRRRPEEEDGGPDDDLLDEELGPAVDHPIWYIRTIGLQPSVINAITIVKYKSADGLVEGTDCAVCLSEFEEDETLRLLPKCSHAFHIACIDTWLTSHTNCPMCRAGIVTTAAGPLPAPHDSGRAEESQSEEAPGSDREEVRVGIEDDEMSENGEGGDCKVDVSRLEGGVLQPVRRSVSMDSSAAAVISAAVANALSDHNSNKQLVMRGKDSKVEDVGRRSVEVNQSLLRLVGSPSIERYMQTAGSSSIKRSASCSAKVFLSRHSSRSRS